MHILMHLKYDDPSHPYVRKLVSIDPAHVAITSGESLIDVFLGLIVQGQASTLATKLKEISAHGFSNWAYVVMPRALREMNVAPDFALEADAEIMIEFEADRVTLPDGTEIDGRSFFGATRDRWSVGERHSLTEKLPEHPLAWREDWGKKGPKDEELRAGSLIVGLIDALGQAALTDRNIAGIAGFFLALQEAPKLEYMTLRDGFSHGTWAQTAIMNRAPLRSTRGWLTPSWVETPLLERMRAEAYPGIRAVGRAMGERLSGVTTERISHATWAAIEAMGEDAVQYHLNSQHPKAGTAHEKMSAGALISSLASLAGPVARQALARSRAAA